jgi:hypothetical protein
MEQSPANENMISGNNETIEICMNDVFFEAGYEVNPSFQTETSGNLDKNIEELLKENFKNLHVQRKIWKPHGRTSLCWKFVLCK